LKLARENDIATIAFPAISTGVYGYPVEPATRIAIREVSHFLENDPSFERVVFVCYDQRTLHVYQRVLKESGTV
jgi:O-acetyl-ADP-ribose deacetylase (regulator of RNase III)